MSQVHPETLATVERVAGPQAETPVDLSGRDTTLLRLGTWVRGLQSFLNPSNLPLPEPGSGDRLNRNCIYETRVTKDALIRAMEETQKLYDAESSLRDKEVTEITGEVKYHEPHLYNRTSALLELFYVLRDCYRLCDAMLESGSVSVIGWSRLGATLSRQAENAAISGLVKLADRQASSALPAPLLDMARRKIPSGKLALLALRIFSEISALLGRLRIVEDLLRGDQPLKPALVIFSLVREDACELVEFIESRGLKMSGIDHTLLETLDATNYAMTMEMRKAFEHELVGVASTRHPPAIYAKVENAHGLLRDCFQQSTVALAEALDPSLDASALFDRFQTKKQQSLMLREDLWKILQAVKKAEEERDHLRLGPLLDQLESFRGGSLRYLMYKDWEAFERFVEEVAIARGLAELAPVLHRFSTYLEALFGQVNMRAILADHPFKAPTA